MDWNSVLKEAITVGVVYVAIVEIGAVPLFYSIFRRRGVSDISKQYEVDSSRINKGNAARLWLNIYEPPFFMLPKLLQNSELEEMAERCRIRLTGVREPSEEVKSQAIAELLENPTVRSYLLV